MKNGRFSAFVFVSKSASPREKHGDVPGVVSILRSPVLASLYLLAMPAQGKHVWFEIAGASALHTLIPFGFNLGDARDRSLIGRCVC